MKPVSDLNQFYSQSRDEVLALLASKPEGLSEEQSQEKRKKHGLNEITQTKKKSLWDKILDNLLEPMVIILFIASAFSVFIKDYIEAAVILGVVIINTIVSLIQDKKAEKAVDELKTLK